MEIKKKKKLLLRHSQALHESEEQQVRSHIFLLFWILLSFGFNLPRASPSWRIRRL